MTPWQHPLRGAREARHWSIDDLAERSGLSRRTIIRAEQGHRLNPDSRHLLADALGMSVAALGVGARQRPGADRLRPGPIDDVTRREFLRRLSAAATALAVPPGAEQLDWERLSRFSRRLRGLDAATLDQYAIVNAHLWRSFAGAPSKGAVFQMVRQQTEVLAGHLEQSHGPATHERLCVLAADLLQLSGEVLFDASLYADAAQCYTLAASAAREAAAYDLWACAITRHAFIGVYERQTEAAVPMLEMADRLAARGDPGLSTRHWVNAVRAQAFAGIGELDLCRRAGEVAEQVDGLAGTPHNGGWLRFDRSRLAEERGACFVELGRPDLAEAALIEALGQGLSMRRRGLVLVDLAAAGAQRRDLDQLSTYGGAALDVAQLTGSGVVEAKLRGLRSRLAPFAGEPVIADLDARIAALAGAS